MNTAHLDSVDDSHFLQGYLKIMEGCDVVILLTESQDSEGTKEEIRRAFELGIPVIHPELFDIWLKATLAKREHERPPGKALPTD